MTGMVGFITLAPWVLREAYESYSQLGGGFKKQVLSFFRAAGGRARINDVHDVRTYGPT